MPARRGSGRKPKPARLRLLEGAGHRPIREGVLVQPICPDRPNWTDLLPNPQKAKGDGEAKKRDVEAERLRRDAQTQWDTVIRELDTLGLLGRADVLVVVDYCVCMARLRQCERALQKDGLWLQGKDGMHRHPATTIGNQYRQQLRFYVSELGLSAASRTRIHLAPGGEGSVDPKEASVFGS